MTDTPQLPFEAPPESSELPGPYEVGDYAPGSQRLREFARVQLVGEVWEFRADAGRASTSSCATPRRAALLDVARRTSNALGRAARAAHRRGKIVVAGGCDYYPGSATSSPGFTFSVTELRVAGEGDLLVQLERLGAAPSRRPVRAPETAAAPAAATHDRGRDGERGKARDDVLAGLARRGWAGRLVWAFAPVQDRFAAPVIAARPA